MVVGEYVVYEKASRDEEQLFLKIAIDVVATVKEPGRSQEIQRNMQEENQYRIISNQ